MDATIALGPFRLGQCIGQGGMGKVFRAVHVDTGTPVAVKVIAEAGDRASRRAFHREVQAHAGLVHPGVVYLFDYGTIDEEAAAASEGMLSAGDSYVAMELAVRGTVCDQMPFRNWQQVRSILMQVLDALAFAHARQVIHRDLKPENLLLFDGGEDEQPQVKLADFGLAHALDEVMRRKEQSLAQFSGTPLYMTPEQIQGKWRRYGPWTDLYALGCVAWHLVCGHPPYVGESLVSVTIQHCDDEFPRLDPQFAIPGGVEAWIRRAMAVEPGARFQCAADAAWALANLDEVQQPVDQHSLAGADAADPKAPTVHMQTLCWPESGQSLHAGATIPDDDTVDLAFADTVVSRHGNFEPEDPDPWANTELLDERPPLPNSWHPPDQEQLPAALVGAGLGLFGLREVPLVNREAERDLIWQSLIDVVETDCLQVVFVSGEAGVGKSRLARWMAIRAHEVGAARVYRALYAPGAREAAAGMAGMIQRAFQTWKLGRGELYEALCNRLPRLGEADDGVEFDARALTEIVYPSGDRDEIAGPRLRFSSSDQKYAVMTRILRRLGRLRSPVVWLDDVHQAPEAIGLIEHLTGSDDPPAGLMVATMRSDILADDPELERRIDELVDTEACQRVALGPIGAADHRELIDRMLPVSPQLRDWLAGRTEGNPMFAHQLLGDLIARGCIETSPGGFQVSEEASSAVPEDIHQVWLGRIERLIGGYPPDRTGAAREAMELAAALGRDVTAREWRAVCTDAGVVISASLVDDLVDRGLATRGEQGWSFAHGLLVESIGRHSAESGRWSQCHRRCATTLERLYPDKTGETARRRADHWLEAGEDERALNPLLEAIDHHLITGDLDTASNLCDLHDAICERLGLGDNRRKVRGLLKRAHLARLVGDVDEFEQILERTESLSRHNGWDEQLAEILVLQVVLARLRGDIESGIDLAQRAVDHCEALDDHKGVASSLRQMGRLQLKIGERQRAHQNIKRSERITRRLQMPRQHAASLQALGIMHLDRGEYDLAVEVLTEALETFQSIGDLHLSAACLNILGESYRHSGDLASAEDYYRQTIETVRRVGLHAYLRVWYLNLGIVLSMQEKYAEATEYFQRSHDVAAEQVARAYIGYIHACWLFASAGLGDWDGFDDHLHRAREHLEQWPLFDRDIAQCCTEAGRLAAEEAQIERARRAWEIARVQWGELNEPDEVAAIDERIEALGAQT